MMVPNIHVLAAYNFEQSVQKAKHCPDSDYISVISQSRVNYYVYMYFGVFRG